MNPGAAFAGGAGASTPVIAALAVGVCAAVVLLWAGWALLSVYRGWAGERVRGVTFQSVSWRIVLLVVVILWIVI